MAKSKNSKKAQVEVYGIKSPDGKPQHLKVGQKYLVDEWQAESMIKNKQASKTKPAASK